MPYGTDSPEDDKWVEKCVNSIDGDYTKQKKIAICKYQLKRKGKSENAKAELSMIEELRRIENMIYKAVEQDAVEPVQSRPWVVDIFDDYLIVEFAGDMYKVNYSIGEETVDIEWGTAIKVDRKMVYEPSESVKVPAVKTTQHRRVTYGPRTVL